MQCLFPMPLNAFNVSPELTRLNKPELHQASVVRRRRSREQFRSARPIALRKIAMQLLQRFAASAPRLWFWGSVRSRAPAISQAQVTCPDSLLGLGPVFDQCNGMQVVGQIVGRKAAFYSADIALCEPGGRTHRGEAAFAYNPKYRDNRD